LSIAMDAEIYFGSVTAVINSGIWFFCQHRLAQDVESYPQITQIKKKSAKSADKYFRASSKWVQYGSRPNQFPLW
jgi:hypothetical protein